MTGRTSSLRGEALKRLQINSAAGAARCRFRVVQEGDPCRSGRYFLQQREPFAAHGGFEMGQPSEVAAGPRQAVHKAPANRVDELDEHDRYAAALAPKRLHHRPAVGEHHLRVGRDKLPRQFLRARSIPRRPACRELQIAALYPAEGLQRLTEGSDARLPFRIAFCGAHHDPNPPHPDGRLRVGGRGPCRDPAEKRHELPPPHSITSSARARRVGATAIPRAFAVFKLRTSSNFEGSSTGRSAGFAPLKILSTKLAARQ